MSDFFAPTKHLLTTYMAPYPCRVCGQIRNRMSPLGGFRDQHDACRKQEKAWSATWRKIISDDPDYLDAEEAAEAARDNLEKVFLDRMAAAGIPDWYATQAVWEVFHDNGG